MGSREVLTSDIQQSSAIGVSLLLLTPIVVLIRQPLSCTEAPRLQRHATMSLMGLRFFSLGSSAAYPSGISTAASSLSASEKSFLQSSASKLHTQQEPSPCAAAARQRCSTAHPLFVVQYRGNDIDGSRSKPLAAVALLQSGSVGIAAHDAETPRLAIDSRRCQPDTLHHIVQLSLLNSHRLVSTAAITP